MTCLTVWDSDTGEFTITAVKDGVPVDLSATTARTVIARNVTTSVVTVLAPVSEDLPNGEVTVEAEGLPRGRYDVVLRAVDVTSTQTYPSACEGPAELRVRPDLDAV